MVRRFLIAMLVGGLLLLGAGCTTHRQARQAKWQEIEDRDLGSGAEAETLSPAK